MFCFLYKFFIRLLVPATLRSRPRVLPPPDSLRSRWSCCSGSGTRPPSRGTVEDGWRLAARPDLLPNDELRPETLRRPTGVDGVEDGEVVEDGSVETSCLVTTRRWMMSKNWRSRSRCRWKGKGCWTGSWSHLRPVCLEFEG